MTTDTCAWPHVYTHTHTHTHTPTHTHTHTHTRMHTCTHKHTQNLKLHVHTCIVLSAKPTHLVTLIVPLLFVFRGWVFFFFTSVICATVVILQHFHILHAAVLAFFFYNHNQNNLHLWYFHWLTVICVCLLVPFRDGAGGGWVAQLCLCAQTSSYHWPFGLHQLGLGSVTSLYTAFDMWEGGWRV